MMNRKFLNSLLFLSTLIATFFVFQPTNAAFRYNQVTSCGPINYCFEGDELSVRDEQCLPAASQCQASGGQVSICYWVETCSGQAPDETTVGPLTPPLTPDPCIQNPELCEDGQPAPIVLDEYDAPEPYTVDANLSNPITSDNVTTLLEKLYRGFLAIVVPILVLVLVYSGFIFVTAQGSEEKLKKAKRNAGYVVIGLIIILAAEVLIAIFKNLVDAFDTL